MRALGQHRPLIVPLNLAQLDRLMEHARDFAVQQKASVAVLYHPSTFSEITTMHRNRTTIFYLSMAFLFSVPSTGLADIANTVESGKDDIEFSKLSTDESGETRFSLDTIPWINWFSSGRRTPKEETVTALGFYHFRSGMDSYFHPAPREQFLVVLAGTLEIEASNGDRRQFPPGAIVLVTDVERTSRGHKTRVIGSSDVFAAVMPTPNIVELQLMSSRKKCQE